MASVVALSPRERRQSERFPLYCPVTVERGDMRHNAVCIDLSASGAKLRVPEKLPEGERVALILYVPGEHYVEAEGEVVHIHASAPAPATVVQDVGIRFDRLASDSLMAVHSFLGRCKSAEQAQNDDTGEDA